MAVVYDPEKDEDKVGEEQPITGGGPSAPSSAPTAGAAQAPVQQRGSGRSINLQDYLRANTGAGQQLAQGVQQRVGQQTQKTQQGLQETQQRFGQRAGELEQEVGEQGEQLVQTAFKDPQQLLQQQQQLEQFQRLRDQGAQQDIASLPPDLSTQRQQLQQTQQLAQQARTEPGRTELLRQTYGGPSYSRGQMSLDQLFLQAQPGAGREMQQALQQQATGLEQQIGTAEEEMIARTEALKGLAGQRAEQIQGLLTGGLEEGVEEQLTGRGLEDIESALQERYDPTKEQAEQLLGLTGRAQMNELTRDELEMLGLEEGQALYDVNLADYLDYEEEIPTLAGVADPEEYTRYQALRQLAGPQQVGDIFAGAEEEQIGTYQAPEYDAEALQQAVAQREEEIRGATQQYAQQLGELFREGTAEQALQGRLAYASAPTTAGHSRTQEMRDLYGGLLDVIQGNYSPEAASRIERGVRYASPRWSQLYGVADRPGEQAAATQMANLAELLRSATPGRTLQAPAPEDLEDEGFFNV